MSSDKSLDELYLSLRHRALTTPLATATPRTVRAICIDYHFEHGILTLISYADGNASLYRSTGGGSLGRNANDPQITDKVHALHAAVESHRALFKEEEDTTFPLPAEGKLTFRIVTSEGVFCHTRSMKGRNRSIAESAVFPAVNELLQVLLTPTGRYFGYQSITPSKPNRKVAIPTVKTVVWTPLFYVFKRGTEWVPSHQISSPVWDAIFDLVKPEKRSYQSYRRTILTLPTPEALNGVKETVAYAAIVEQKSRGGCLMTTLQQNGTVDLLHESRRPAMGADRNRPNVIRSVRAFLRDATSCLPCFSPEQNGSHPAPSAQEITMRLITNHGVYAYQFPHNHPELCPEPLLKLVNAYFNLLDTLQG
jgi:hypothetical protein